MRLWMSATGSLASVVMIAKVRTYAGRIELVRGCAGATGSPAQCRARYAAMSAGVTSDT
jgi:hypothetical protein